MEKQTRAGLTLLIAPRQKQYTCHVLYYIYEKYICIYDGYLKATRWLIGGVCVCECEMEVCTGMALKGGLIESLYAALGGCKSTFGLPLSA